jgi:hypothetical protein
VQARPVFRRAQFGDYERIAALESRHGMRSRPRDQWTHLWTNNPAYREIPDWPAGWVFETDCGQIVGHIANVPLRYVFGGSMLMAATSGDLVVDAPYRLYAFRLLGHYLSQKNVSLFVDTTATATTSRAHETLHIPRVPAGAWDRSAFWITNYDGFMSSVLAKRRTPLRGLLAKAASVAFRMKDRTARRRLRAWARDNIQYCSGFDERFDVFWQALQRRRPAVLLAERSRSVLDWHFRHALAAGRAWILTATAGNALTAYSVMIRDDRPAFGLKRMRLVDFQTLEANGAGLAPMIAAAFTRCQAEGIDMLEALGFAHEKKDIIDSLAPHHRSLPAWPYFYKANDGTLGEALRQPAVWDPSGFDGDASL